jgi:hypothetical protein
MYINMSFIRLFMRLFVHSLFHLYVCQSGQSGFMPLHLSICLSYQLSFHLSVFLLVTDTQLSTNINFYSRQRISRVCRLFVWFNVCELSRSLPKVHHSTVRLLANPQILDLAEIYSNKHSSSFVASSGPKVIKLLFSVIYEFS